LTDTFDIVIIGSGISGLCCGALLAQSNMKVLVLEQHNKIGGYAHNFKRKKFTFESGIHSVPLSPDGVVMHVLKLLKIENKIKPIELPSMYSIDIPEGSFTIPSRQDQIIEFFRNLSTDKSDISKLLAETDRFYKHICEPVFNFENTHIEEDTSFVSQFHNYSYHDFIKSISSNKLIRTLMCGQWPYSGISAESGGSLFSFVMFLLHFREGSYFMEGGFSSLANALSDVITDNGGSVLTRKRVNNLVVEQSSITKVCTSDGSIYNTKSTVSNVSPYILHNELLPPEHQGKRWIRRLNNLNPSLSSIIVYLGMNPSFLPLVPNEISFWYETSDFNKIYQKIKDNKKDSIDHLITLRSTGENEFPTLTLMNFVQKSYSTNWQSDKKNIADMMLKNLESRIPGINKFIDVMEIGRRR
jgi:prolycopene isomerase